jgi:arylamine N-acetyltransferase
MAIKEEIERLLVQEFKNVPFHNLFMLNDFNCVGTKLGGTCSDKVIHFKKILAENGIESKLHSAFINGIDCHRLLTVEISLKSYFIDVGSGWANTKLIPAFEEIEYDAYGMSYRTELTKSGIRVLHKTDIEYKLMMLIPTVEMNETEILDAIEKRYHNKSIYPFNSSLRFSKLIGDTFYFIKGNQLRKFSSQKFESQQLNKMDLYEWLTQHFEFDLKGLEYYFP